MTREEAIEVLRHIAQVADTSDCGIKEIDGTDEEALEMAIKALGQEPCGDCVSRQAVTDCFKKWQPYMATRMWEFEKELKELPSVKPQEPKTEWIPVSEGLPKNNMPCLVSVGEFFLTQIAMYSDLMGTIDHKIFYMGDYGKENFEDITKYVKAWQPSPESYKESEE